jgi:hypothetical protein
MKDELPAATLEMRAEAPSHDWLKQPVASVTTGHRSPLLLGWHKRMFVLFFHLLSIVGLELL